MKFIKVSAAIALLTGSAAAAEKKCHALALSGGGAKGAYEAGVLWGLVNNANSSTSLAWDVVTGVSIGSVNTGGIVLWAPGDEKGMVQWLSDTWAGLKSSDIYVDWKPLGIVTGLL